jgi:hypothetical protein
MTNTELDAGRRLQTRVNARLRRMGVQPGRPDAEPTEQSHEPPTVQDRALARLRRMGVAGSDHLPADAA